MTTSDRPAVSQTVRVGGRYRDPSRQVGKLPLASRQSLVPLRQPSGQDKPHIFDKQPCRPKIVRHRYRYLDHWFPTPRRPPIAGRPPRRRLSVPKILSGDPARISRSLLAEAQLPAPLIGLLAPSQVLVPRAPLDCANTSIECAGWGKFRFVVLYPGRNGTHSDVVDKKCYGMIWLDRAADTPSFSGLFF
jgi:hypothetical protein